MNRHTARWAVAVHETGHYLVLRELGFAPRWPELHEQGGRVIYDEARWEAGAVENKLAALLAGNVAERLKLGAVFSHHSGAADDEQRVADLLAAGPWETDEIPDTLQKARVTAEVILRAQTDSLQAIAEDLWAT